MKKKLVFWIARDLTKFMHMKKPSLLIPVVFFLFLATSLQAQQGFFERLFKKKQDAREEVVPLPEPAPLPENALTVGCWNLRLKPPPAFMRDGDFHDPLFIAHLISQAQTPLWSIQEMFADYETEEGELRNHYMDSIVLTLDRLTESSWQYFIGDAKDDRGQNVGFLWNSERVEPVEDPRVVQGIERRVDEETGSPNWKRLPVVGRFKFPKEGLALTLVSVYHKGYDGPDVQVQRANEAAELLRCLKTHHRLEEGENLVVMGRMADSFQEKCTRVYASVGLRDLNESNQPSLLHGTEIAWATTRIFVRSNDEKIFPEKSMRVLGPRWLAQQNTDLHNFIYYASNCLPVIAVVKVPE